MSKILPNLVTDNEYMQGVGPPTATQPLLAPPSVQSRNAWKQIRKKSITIGFVAAVALVVIGGAISMFSNGESAIGTKVGNWIMISGYIVCCLNVPIAYGLDRIWNRNFSNKGDR